MTKPSATTRREFLREAALSALALGAAARDVLASQQPAGATGLPTRVLGRTDERVSILCLGGWHIGSVKDSTEAIRIMHAAVDEGLTFFDNCWDYHDGGAEEVMGRALADGRRNRVFLMTKNCERDYAGSMKCLDDSLRRLRTDRIDLWQFHEIIYDNDPDWVFEKGGLKAALEARKAGKVRYIGFTGHKDPRIHLSMLEKPFEWDACQFPVNVLDLHYRSFQKQVLPVCLKKRVGAIGMKGFGGGNGIAAGAGLTSAEAYRFALSQPIASQVVGMTTLEHLQQNVALARAFTPLPETEQAALADRVKPFATDGRFEQFKSTQTFDGPVHRRQHGFSA
ncbi:MAG TPA: aldo/keto reductase [Vicinamibacterales bacterium]|nr:aldo/keto reductase [Vicinamibacterales bacterium]